MAARDAQIAADHRPARLEIERLTPSLFAEYQAAAAAVGAKVVETRTTTSDHQSGSRSRLRTATTRNR